MGSRKNDFGDGASPGKIFIGGLAKETTLEQFVKYFEKYGEIIDSVIMKDRHTGRPRGFGFITYADPSVVDTVIAETHIINDKQDFKTKKVFVGGIPTTMNEDEFKGFFSKYGKVTDCEIIRDHVSKRSRGFGFIVFDNEQVVDNVLSEGNMIDMLGTQVEIKKAEPKKPSNSASGPAFGSESRGRGAYNDSYGGFGNSYNSSFGPASYRSSGGMGGRFGDYGGYGGGEFGGRYGDFGGGEFGGRYGDPSLGYSSRYGSYAGGYGGGAGGYGGSGLMAAYGRGAGYGGYGGAGSGAGYESGPGAGYGGGPGGLYGGSRTGYSGSGRYHPYAR
ncbi:hypothetical protein RND71_036613 [Anisodus tanguticus]|uniref:RRM domain-containing protein n=1 Tax=Anisodus tanguticus TaxID=243964 RepID=A0AAE1R2I8_9SOLA|nr:hypothetical protein RND71_036613 [Anisodus tanguticus]